ncbi:anthranilate synthase component I family protein [Legionella sp. W05-934-2]|uniref:anthranilate synthase component I family protein n=1 Tax=Legionella sp. W05-934-2 TaxID=1198649 RepID=UPI003462E01E
MKQIFRETKQLVLPSDLLSTYRQLASLPGFALLKSDGKNNGNWDIVTALPFKSQTLHRLEDIASILEIEEEFNQPTAGHYPFQGGIIGYISYNYGVLAHGIPLQAHNPYHNLPLVCLNWYRWCIAINHQEKSATLIYETDDDTLANVSDIQQLWQNSILSASTQAVAEVKSLWQKSDYENAFNLVMDGLKTGRCYQVNLAQTFCINTTVSSWQLYEQIARQNPEPYGAFLAYDSHQILSFSPECFITVDGNKVTTCPIKGSAPRCHENPKLDWALAQALKTSEKDRAENVMIVDLMRHDLSKIAEKGSVRVNQLCALHSYPQIHHLVSEVVAIKKDCYSAIEVLLSSFPGGSITGAPKVEAMTMIAELELSARGPYCGSLFYYSRHGRLDSNIAIRTMTAIDQKFWLHAGGGIVIDSRLEQEYEECLIKLSAILNAVKTH